MRDNDGRKLSKEAREQLRMTAVRRVMEGGEKATDVIKAIGFQTSCIFRWLAAYRAGGYEALKDNPNHGGRPPILDRTWCLAQHHKLKKNGPQITQIFTD